MQFVQERAAHFRRCVGPIRMGWTALFEGVEPPRYFVGQGDQTLSGDQKVPLLAADLFACDHTVCNQPSVAPLIERNGTNPSQHLVPTRGRFVGTMEREGWIEVLTGVVLSERLPFKVPVTGRVVDQDLEGVQRSQDLTWVSVPEPGPPPQVPPLTSRH